MRTKFLCVSVLRVASGPWVKLASCKSALNRPVVYSTDRSKAVVPVLVLLFVALWFILRGDLLYVFPFVILFLCLQSLPRLGKRELILVLFVRLFDLCLFGFVGFLFLLGSGKGCGLWLWHSLHFSLTFFFNFTSRYLGDLLNIDNIYFDQKMDRIYPKELQLNWANSSDTEAPFLDLNLWIYDGTVSIKIYDKWDDFDFDTVNFPFLDGDVSPAYLIWGTHILTY